MRVIWVLETATRAAEFVVDNIEWWWEEFGKYEYRRADRILILCDSGGANGHRHHLFKKLLQELARKIGKKLVIVHYPPYCSKYNPIERRLFLRSPSNDQGNDLNGFGASRPLDEENENEHRIKRRGQTEQKILSIETAIVGRRSRWQKIAKASDIAKAILYDIALMGNVI